MLPTRVLIPAAILSLGSASQGAAYHSDFSGHAPGTPLPPIDGWSQSEPNNVDTSPLSWIGEIQVESSFIPSASVGGFWDEPAGDRLFASRNIDMRFSMMSLDITFTLYDSSADFPARNNFFISMADGSGNKLFSVDFLARNQDDNGPVDVWNVETSSPSGSTPVGAGAAEDSTYRIIVDFSPNPNGTDVDFDLDLISVAGSVSQAGTLIGAADEDLGELQFGAEKTVAEWGDNFISVTEISVVPEPSSVLLLGLSSFGLLRRRR